MRSVGFHALAGVVGVLSLVGQGLFAAAASVDSTVLIFARNDADAKEATAGLDGYGIPYQTVMVPQNGITLPTLNSSTTQGNYGGIIIVGSVSYEINGTWGSALTSAQMDQIHAYQTAFKVRMVYINDFPGPRFGAATAKTTGDVSCCTGDLEQRISLTNTDLYKSANIKADAGVSTKGLWHVPGRIDTSIAGINTTEVASFEAAGDFTSKTTAAVVNIFEGGREQWVWFTSSAPDWSATSRYLAHAHIAWMTRGLFVGKRKIHLSAQIDDVNLITDLYLPANGTYKCSTGDLDAHATWQRDLNSRLPSGSSFWIELGHNGNGNIIAATAKPQSEGVCNPNQAVDYPPVPDIDPFFKKPPGTGVDLWPASLTTYPWSLQCAKLDDLGTWFTNKDNLNAFGHVSHTFTHEELNNATYSDASREISFNQAWLKQLGIDQAERFSPRGIIPPAITGLHNADAIKAWTDNGIRFVVGDNTRPILRNSNNMYWPLATTEQTNGATGITIIPRYATTIYYNCDKATCTLQEWKDTSAGSGDFNSLLDDARSVNTRYLLGLQADPYMFHQANLRQTDVDSITVGSQTGKMSLVMAWVETVTQEMARLTNWPIVTIKHDDIAAYFLDRQTLDGCKPKSTLTYSADGKSVTAVTVTANGNSCSVPVPVSIPGGAVTSDGAAAKMDQVGSEPPIAWVTLSGQPVTLSLGTPVQL